MDLFDNKIIHKFCYGVNGYTISVSRINTTIHMYLTVRSGTSPLGDVPGGLQCSEKSEQMLRRIAEMHRGKSCVA